MRIGIVAGESSGDLLGAGLIRALRARYPDAIIEGIAGPRMIEAGCKALYPADKLSLLGLVEVLGHYRELRGIRQALYEHFLDTRPDVFVGIDVPDFNLGLQDKLHRAGIATVQYVSPQVWAWRRYRIHKIARALDLVLCLFPFEVDFYREHDVDAEFVGHPLADSIDLEVSQSAARQRLGLPEDKRIIALLPGSRMSEVKRLAKTFIDTARWCYARDAQCEFVVPLASPGVAEVFKAVLAGQGEDLPMTLIDGQSHDAMAAADVVLMASGTAALEGILLKRPVIVAYRMAWLSYQILRHWVRLPYYSLPNLLANEAIVPEFLQQQANPEQLGRAIFEYLEQPDRIDRLVDRFTAIHESLRLNTSQRAAEAILRVAGVEQ
ncbi:MAG: lipid-A-disaccharide synthase [Granulosicoccaceae bacterium]|jgi:lipid-A-disaccharide synthase